MIPKVESEADKAVIAGSRANSKLWPKWIELLTSGRSVALSADIFILGDDLDAARHQVSEVPRSKAFVTEYRRHSLRCLACGEINQADWPGDMPRGSFGPRAQAIDAYLTARLTASHRDMAEAMEVLHFAWRKIRPGQRISFAAASESIT
jgi:hypothetical protein